MRALAGAASSISSTCTRPQRCAETSATTEDGLTGRTGGDSLRTFVRGVAMSDTAVVEETPQVGQFTRQRRTIHAALRLRTIMRTLPAIRLLRWGRLRPPQSFFAMGTNPSAAVILVTVPAQYITAG